MELEHRTTCLGGRVVISTRFRSYRLGSMTTLPKLGRGRRRQGAVSSMIKTHHRSVATRGVLCRPHLKFCLAGSRGAHRDAGHRLQLGLLKSVNPLLAISARRNRRDADGGVLHRRLALGSGDHHLFEGAALEPASSAAATAQGLPATASAIDVTKTLRFACGSPSEYVWRARQRALRWKGNQERCSAGCKLATFLWKDYARREACDVTSLHHRTYTIGVRGAVLNIAVDSAANGMAGDLSD